RPDDVRSGLLVCRALQLPGAGGVQLGEAASHRQGGRLGLPAAADHPRRHLWRRRDGTEGAALAVLAALFIGGVIYRELNWKHLYESMLDGGIQTAVVMLLVASSALLGHLLTELQMPQQIAAWMTSLTEIGKSTRLNSSH